MLSKPELFGRLAQGHAAGITVLTPNRRLSEALVAEFDAWQIGRGLAVWEAADILPYPAFVERLWEDALYSGAGEKLPALLGASQEQLLWEEILANSDLLAIPRTAAQCRDAWRLQHAWRIGLRPGNEDVNAFRLWSDQYQTKTKNQVDAARLPDLVAEQLQHIRKPKLLIAYAFDILPPQAEALFQKFEFEQCQPEPVAGEIRRAAYASGREELEAAAQWARARLEAGGKRIGVVVPDLQARRAEVLRVFSRVMQPGHSRPGEPKTAMPFNVSLGLPLTSYPLVDAALALIEFSIRELPFARASRLLRSPFLGGAETEAGQRAALDAHLRRHLDATVTLRKLIAAVERCALLRSLLEQVLKTVNEGKAESPSDWARHYSALLEAAGFPGERALDSEEFQARAKWHQALSEFSRLERVSAQLGSKEAFGILQRLCQDTLFQAESAEVPVQVLGILESAGLRFDGLWVSGLTDEAWPLDARPNPFLPVALQKAAGIAQASAESSLALDRRITEDWKQAAAEVVFSAPLKENDRDLSPSPLIADIAMKDVSIPEFPVFRNRIFEISNQENLKDQTAPAFPGGKVGGGTRVLADQAACPFRAFARHRLGARTLEEPAAGLDASQRGSLLHALMKHLWMIVRDSMSLEGSLAPAIARAAEAAVKDLGIEGRFAELERIRLVHLAREWLAVERERPAFTVVAIEQKMDIAVGALEFSARIDRLDRLEAGGHALIDYKSGGANRRDWLGERPDDPQLPLYALSAKEEITAVAFATLKRGDLRFRGYAQEKGLIPRVDAYADWAGLKAGWKREIDSLGAGFAAGQAQVDPKHGLKTCRLCDLQTLCRVYEKAGFAGEDEEE